MECKCKTFNIDAQIYEIYKHTGLSKVLFGVIVNGSHSLELVVQLSDQMKLDRHVRKPGAARILL